MLQLSDTKGDKAEKEGWRTRFCFGCDKISLVGLIFLSGIFLKPCEEVNGWDKFMKMLRDDDIFPRHTNMDLVETEEVVSFHETVYANDHLDDVFGSAPGSPTFENDVHDVGRGRGNLEPSDVPRLKEKHETEGYRDGVTRGKAESVQKGFDEGYGLGAVLGLKIGKILGLLEGIVGGVKVGERDGEVGWRKERERVDGLFEEARKELGTKSVFASEWWGEDGIWKFEVEGENEGKEVTFPDVAAAHPLVRKWEGVVDGEVTRWGLDLGIMDGEHEEAEAVEEDISGQKSLGANHSTGKPPSDNTSTSKAKVMGVPKEDLDW